MAMTPSPAGKSRNSARNSARNSERHLARHLARHTGAWSVLLLSSLTACVGAGAGTQPAAAATGKLLTLDGQPPLVFAHRGLPGLRPEETGPSYEMAADMGADALEHDLHLSKDCQLVARHNPWLSDNTNIAEVARLRPEFAARQRTVVVDGENHRNDWSISDFTLAELQSLGGTTYDAATERPSEFNGRFPIVTFQQIIHIARDKSRASGRRLSLYPESKNPSWNNQQAIANGCDRAGSGHPLEDALFAAIDSNGLNRRDAPIFVQSFEPGSLLYLRRRGLNTRLVQLIGGGRPYDWTVAGDPRGFSSMVTTEGLAQIKSYADGIGPGKGYIVRHAASAPASAATTNTDGNAPAPVITSLISDAHKAGLFVHAYTFRNEARYLAPVYRGDPQAEYLMFYRLGIDGVFSDFTHTAVAARAVYLSEIGAANVAASSR